MKAEFLKRPDNDVFFTCKDGDIIEEMVNEAEKTGERVERPVTIDATVASGNPDEPVAKFILTLSVKKSSR